MFRFQNNVRKLLKLSSTKWSAQEKSFFYRCSSSYTFNISGVYPPIITNFDKNGQIHFETIQKNLEKWEKIPFKGYVVLGSTGEFVFLTEKERCKLVGFLRKSAPANKLVIAGTGCESTISTIELTNQMADVGADAALIVSPFFYKGRMTEDTLLDHYIKIAEASMIPIILYSVPANTGIDLSASLVEKLADHPNIIGLKDSGGDITKIGSIVKKTKGKDFQVLAGSAGFFYTALSIGCVGGVLALANVLGQPSCDLYQYALDGEHDKARQLQHRLISPNLCVTKQFGIAGVKAAMDLSGYIGGSCRPPLKDLSLSDITQLKKEFQDNGFL